LIHSTLVPSAIRLDWPAGEGGRVGVLFEGVEPSVVAQASALQAIVDSGQVSVDDDGEGAEPHSVDMTPPVPRPTEVELKITCLPNRLSDVVGLIQAAAGRASGGVHVTGNLGNGVLQARIDGADAAAAAEMVGRIRAGLREGSVTVVSAPLEVKRRVDVWGPIGDAFPLMRRVKDRFDPDHILNPGRFVGGI
jgi:glycolate oxidase FAD binding subunit